MARRKVNEIQILSAAEELLLERGYDGFHFRALADRLSIGRSTLYEYYSGKEEIIVTYMNQAMENVMKKCEPWKDKAPLERLKGFCSVFMQYTQQMHCMAQIMPKIERTNSCVEQKIEKLFRDHHRIYTWIFDAINEAKKRGEIRDNLSTSLITAMIFSSIQLPNWMDDQEKISGEMIFDLLQRGFQAE